MSPLKAKLIDEVIRIEGGDKYTNDPKDSGGPTKWGITEEVARTFGYKGDMRDMPRSVAEEIYSALFWESLNLDVIEKLSPVVAEELFESGVNCGPGTAAKWLQRCLNVLNDEQKLWKDLKVDGGLGDRTLEALESYFRIRKDPTVLLRMLNCLQGDHYIRLAERREKDERFIYGWMLRRVII